MSFQGGGGRGGRGGGRGAGRCSNDQTDISSEQFRKLFVGGLSYETDEKSLKSHFEQWGEVADCVVMRDPDTKRSRGFGFITYKESFMIDEAQKNRPHKIDNREVETKRAMPRNADGASNHQSVKKMFVGGLKDDTTEEQMRDVFGKFGEIDSVNILADTAPGKCRGFAFITYKDYDSVDRAVLLKRHDLNTRRVEVKKAVPKDQMDGTGRGGGSVGWVPGRGGGGSCGYSSNGPFRGGYGGGSFGGSGGGYAGGLPGGQNWGGSIGYGNHRGGYGGGSFGVSGGYYGGGYAGGQNWGGSSGYGNHNSSWGGGGGASGFGSNYGGNYGGGPVKGGSGGPVKGGSSGPVKGGGGGPVKGGGGGPMKSNSDMQPVAKDLMEVAMDTLTVAAAAMVVVDSDDKVKTEAAEYPEHMNIQEANPRKRKRRQEKPQSSQRLMLSREKTEPSVEKHDHHESGL